MDEASRLGAGDHIGEFEIVRPLKGGGMGYVYVAREGSTGASVALKVVGATSVADAIRFERESRLAEGLRHPHIIEGRGHGRTDEGMAWLSMELLDGEDLEARLAAGAFSPTEVLQVAAQVCEALEYAHARGVIHRDLKPSNIFLCRGAASTPWVKVLDFGIARSADERPLTRTGVPIGTPAYMSPEQARGLRDLDPRTDLWSLGVVLYECLARRTPFLAENLVGFLFQVVDVTPPDLGELAPGLSPSLLAVVERALRKAREERFPTASAMRAALAAVDLTATPAAPSRGPASAEPKTAPTEMSRTLGDGAEVRLTSAVCLAGVRDPVFIQGVARELRARLEVLATGEILALFGIDLWSGDEPSRAVRFALAVAPAARAIGVATGRVLRSARSVAGTAVEAAAALAQEDGVRIEDVTAAAVRGRYVLTPVQGGAWVVSRPLPAPDSVLPEPDEVTCVGREAELAVLSRSVETARQELRTTAVTVLGPSGIGKSRLRREAAKRVVAACPDATFVVARGEGFLRDTPFAALDEALAPVVDPGVIGAFRAVIQGGGDPVATLDRARASLLTLIEGLAAQGPVVIAVDDVQWLDPSSRATLRWLREQALDLPLALWVFGRPDASQVAADITGAAPFELGPLDRASAAQLLRAVGGQAPEALIERAAGHPLFLEELGRVLKARGEEALAEQGTFPISVEGAYLTQLDQVPPTEREFLKRASVLGRTFWLDGAVRLGAEADAAPGLRRASMIQPRPRSRFAGTQEYVFRVRAHQEVTYGLLPDALRARFHARAATWLAEQASATPDELARHWDLAGDRVQAAEAHAAAAEVAAKVADTATACDHAERVLALTDDPALRWRALVARDTALQLTDQLELARRGLAELTEVARALGLRHQTEAAWRRCYFERITYHRDAALAAGQEALARADALGDPRWGAAVHIDLAILHAEEGAADEARAHAHAARDLAGRADDGWLKARAIATLAYVVAEAGAPGESLEPYALAADGFARAGDRRREALMRANMAWALLRFGRVEEAERQTVAAIEASQRIGNTVTVASCTHNLGVLRRITGDFARAESLQAQAEATASKRGNARLVSAALTERAYLALLRGEDVEALALATKAAERAEAARAPALLASARAVSLRAEARAGVVSRDAVEAARALAASQKDAEGRVELLVALWEASGRAEADRLAAREAVEVIVARVDAPTARDACREALRRRYVIADEVLGG